MLHNPPGHFAADRRADSLTSHYSGATAEDVLHAGLRLFAGEIALVSSFGAESAVLLHMAAQINPHVPVLLVDTQMLFPETLAYQMALTDHLGLTDVRRIRPDAGDLGRKDRFDALHLSDTDACCDLRKVRPLARGLRYFNATISGRKRFQSGTRAAMSLFEADPSGRIKVNPLAEWAPEDLPAYAKKHDLPAHPLVKSGFLSIGCAPCTTPVGAGEDPRAGRWRGSDKIECGIHFGPNGVAERMTS